ncbi:MAG: YueI family protein [Lactobacillus sp.]|uniref:YueI family protein n=1 Tax=Limosilactobacillus coleohominis TaxID=181675 RepID=UPI002A918CF8|nr:YueI family protein [Limosilactobacillus coleohominis]MCI5812781.1 YueI family protein [Lactobacillus sp.]MDY5629086.1 YueI family protein [Limosilactobacillus coleohominis]
MPDKKSEIDQRIQNGIYGTPKIKPDEQRHYMGTFRERVWLTISVAEINNNDWSFAVREELTKHPDSLVIINGNLADHLTRNYIMLANQMQVQFTIKTGSDAKTTPDSLALVISDHKAVYESPVDVQKKYSRSNNNHNSVSPKKNSSIWKRLFKI